MTVVITYKQKEPPVDSFTFKCASTGEAILADVRSATIYFYKNGRTIFVLEKQDAAAVGKCIINMSEQE